MIHRFSSRRQPLAVRRSREFLEETIDPATGEPYLKPVRVKLFGEGADEAIILPPYLQDAYQQHYFCRAADNREDAQ